MSYGEIISLENILDAWKGFLVNKKSKKDVQEFERNLMRNIFSLHHSLQNKIYTHGGYTAFQVNDPKPRDIHKASVRDRVVHHLVYRAFYPYFDTKFIHDSYSCRKNKGTHKAILRFESFARKVSHNNTKQCFVLKCDIRKFFASIDHAILKDILKKYIQDTDVLNLLDTVIDSFLQGLPLGNLTSQLLVNIYMNEFDQFVKHKLKVKYYIRYADDFVLFSNNKEDLQVLVRCIELILQNKLKLDLHPNKVFIKTLGSGIDFLGWVHFPQHRILRTSTKKRMMRRIQSNPKEETIESYLGMLKWGDAYGLRKQIEMYKTCK